MKTKNALLAAFAAVPMATLSVLALPVEANAASSTTYTATLAPLNHATGSGTLTLKLTGNQAAITEHYSGLATRFMNAPYPHVQHIHIDGMGMCPTASADTSGDGVVSTTEGAPHYGKIGVTLSVSGDTSPAAALSVGTAPSGGSADYNRTVTLDPDTLASLKAGKAVIVVHGLDPSTLSAAAQAEKSDLTATLPLAATSPALCGSLVAAQMGTMPTGGAATGGGSTSGFQNSELLAVGGGLVLFAGAGSALVARRRRSEIRNEN